MIDQKEIPNDIIRKIQKLLALAESPNVHEAEAAAQKAQDLLVKYNLDIQQARVNLEYEKTLIAEGKRRPKEFKFTQGIISKYFFVEVVTSFAEVPGMGRLYFMGTKTNVQIASYAYDYLNHNFRELWTQYRKETGSPANACQSYYWGLSEGFKKKLDEQRAKSCSERGLVLVKDGDLSRFTANQFANLKESSNSISASDSDAIQAGKQAGYNLNISQGVKGSATNAGKTLGYSK